MKENKEDGGQCGTTGAAEMAQEAGVKKLVLVHTGPNLSLHGNKEKGIGDVSKIFDGKVVFSDELMLIDI